MFRRSLRAQCDTHYRTPTEITRRGAWTADEDGALPSAIKIYSNGSVITWKQVAKLIDGLALRSAPDGRRPSSGERPSNVAEAGIRKRKRKWPA
ncbi:hypothetical protein AURDEDRAFT_161636 [Auricularia subglabra TFB-10046 SS5]|nr:hypothetical protein AURDEDRAFT_161636 [Auricularia subglabra TFB-10046 SS5]